MIDDIKKTVEQKMQQSLAAFKLELSKVRTGRAHTSILDHVIVEYYGSDVVISQVANVTLVDARTISVQPWEKSMLAKIEKAIREKTTFIAVGGGHLGGEKGVLNLLRKQGYTIEAIKL